MTVKEAMREKNMTIYRLAKCSGIPYATVNDICNGKAQLEKCAAETVYRLAHALEMTMEDLLAPYMVKRSSFENFKSTICHQVKELGDMDFILKTLESGDIRVYYERRWYPESLYLLAMLDYLSRENQVPVCTDYDDIRKCRLEKPVYPAGVQALSLAAKDDSILKQAEAKAIPEFLRFNIVENEVRSAV